MRGLAGKMGERIHGERVCRTGYVGKGMFERICGQVGGNEWTGKSRPERAGR